MLIVRYNRCRPTMRSLFNKSLRTNISVLQRSNVIYMIRCSDCSACYVGKQRESYTPDCVSRAALKGRGFSCKAEHSLRAGHRIDWTNVEVIGSDCSDIRLLFKETFLIKKHKPTMKIFYIIIRPINRYCLNTA